LPVELQDDLAGARPVPALTLTLSQGERGEDIIREGGAVDRAVGIGNRLADPAVLGVV
jgi:hypothetical protein